MIDEDKFNEIFGREDRVMQGAKLIKPEKGWHVYRFNGEYLTSFATAKEAKDYVFARAEKENVSNSYYYFEEGGRELASDSGGGNGQSN
jgi:hypothetical protein